MFVCALDIRQFSLRMVLTVKTPVPIFLEGQIFQFPVETALILNTLGVWADFYEGIDYLTGCLQDPWSTELETVLRTAGYRIRWVERECIDRVVKIWKSLRPDARWMRGGLMSYLCPSEDQAQSSDEVSDTQVFEWIYATLRDRIVDLEGKLIAEGRDICPGHLIERCPLCETGYEESGGLCPAREVSLP